MLGSGAIELLPKKLEWKMWITFSHHLLEKVVGFEVVAEANEHLKWCDIVLDGDHGQSAFHWPVKLVLKYNNQPTVKLKNWLTEIVCNKESYELSKKYFLNPSQTMAMSENKLIHMGAEKGGRDSCQ